MGGQHHTLQRHWLIVTLTAGALWMQEATLAFSAARISWRTWWTSATSTARTQTATSVPASTTLASRLGCTAAFTSNLAWLTSSTSVIAPDYQQVWRPQVTSISEGSAVRPLSHRAVHALVVSACRRCVASEAVTLQHDVVCDSSRKP